MLVRRLIQSATINLIVLAGAGVPCQAVEPGFGITASSVCSGSYLPEFAFDAKGDTRWASMPIAGKPEWLQIDFGRAVTFEDVTIRWERAYPAEYQIQVSDDGRTYKTLHEQPQCKGGVETVKGLGGKGRYVRINCTRPSPQWGIASIWEVEYTGGDADAAVADVKRRAEEARKAAKIEARRQLTEFATGGRGVEEIVFAMRALGSDGHWYANFGYYSNSQVKTTDFSPFEKDGKRIAYNYGGKLCRLNLATGEKTLLIDDPTGGVRDPVVHYDAKKILFSYRRGDSQFYNLYEINIDGTGLTQITDGPFDDIEPCYLPDGDIVFVSSRCKRWVQCWVTQVAVLHRCKADGTDIRAISANLEHDNTPWVLPDGRILYQRWEYVDRSQVDYHHLWTTNPDGTSQMVYYGNMHPGIVMIDAKPIPETDKVVSIFSPRHGRREHDGRITVIDPRKGPDDRSFARGITKADDYRDPWAFSESTFMAARGTQLLMLNDQRASVVIYTATDDERRAGLQCHEPRPIMPRQRERIIPDRTQPTQPTGTVVLMDVYTGRNLGGIERGDIKKLLVVEALPKPINFTGGMDPLTYGGSFTLERVLGTVPVEADGSAHVEMPAMRALFFVALDENDMAVKRMRSFLTVQPGEVTSCVGCHEQRTQTFQPKAEPMALKRPASKIEAYADCPEVFDFPRDIQPILDRLCVDCHGYDKTNRGGPYAGNISLSGDHGPMFSHAYFTMTVAHLFSDNRNRAVSNDKPRSLGSAASRIFKLVDGSHHGVKATEHDKRMLRLWIELGAPYPGTYAALGCGSIGGYHENRLVNTDGRWPSTRAGAEVIARRCNSCHTGSKRLPRSLSDELGISFWRFSINDARLQMSWHIMFNLSRPEKSLIALAPLSKKAGGLELCRDKQGKPLAVLADTNDPDYQKLVAMAAGGKENLDQIKRFDMPRFVARPQYLREMKRYGILAPDHPYDVPVDLYELEQRYFESLWFKPATNQQTRR